MTTVTLSKGMDGRLEGFDDKARRVYGKFLARLKNLLPGQTIAFTYKVPRSPKFHRLHFAMLRELYDNQEQFADTYQFRKWLEVGAGHCDFVPGPKGRMVALPKSIAYEELDDEQFSDVHEGVKRFLRTEHAARFLWPEVDPAQAQAGVEAILGGFENG